MFAISSLAKKVIQKLQNNSYRRSYVAEHVRRNIAYQIRALREQRQWNQGKFATLLRKPQSVVSRVEDPSYGKVTVQTLLEIASTFDVALQIRFVSYSTFLQQTRDLTTTSMYVPSFNEEMEFKSPIRLRGDMWVVETQKRADAQVWMNTNDEHSAVISNILSDTSGTSLYVN